VLALVAALVLVALLSSGAQASPSASASASQLAKAKSVVAEFSKRPTKISIKTPIKGKIPKGKTVEWVVCGVPACLNAEPALRAAAKAVGWKVKKVLAGGTPEEVQAAMNKAVADKPDAVINQSGFPDEVTKSQVAALKKAGTPVVADGLGVTSIPSGYIGLVEAGPMYENVGVRNAQYVAAKTNCKANVLFYWPSAYAVLTIQKKSFTAELKKICPSAKVKAYDAPLTSIGTDLPQRIKSLVQADPKINVLVPAFSDLLQGLPEALKGAGISPSKLTIVTSNQNGTVNKQLKSGDVDATFAQPTGEIKWNAIDLLIRYFTHQSLKETNAVTSTPQWWATGKTLPSATNNATGFDLVQGYAAQYKKLWGVG
jgi:ribose transport system substrate-binding protein